MGHSEERFSVGYIDLELLKINHTGLYFQIGEKKVAQVLKQEAGSRVRKKQQRREKKSKIEKGREERQGWVSEIPKF